MPDRTLILRTIAAALAGAMFVGGCGPLAFPGSAGAQPIGAPGAPGVLDPAGPVAKPGGVGGGTSGDTGSGTGTGQGSGSGGGTTSGGIVGGGVAPNSPTLVVTHPGMVNLLAVSAVELASRIASDGHVIVRVRWWGGIEPCETLDSVLVDRAGDTFALTARVGSQPGAQVACIDIARDTATLVDLGALASGTYTVRAGNGTAPAITVVVP